MKSPNNICYEYKSFNIVYSVHSYKSLHKSKSLKEPKPLEKDFKTQILVSIPKIMYPIKYTPAYIKMKSTYMKAM
jgi:hypothetical protein